MDALGLSEPYRFIRCLVLSLFSMASCINRSMVAIDICARPDSMDRYSDIASSPAFQRLGRIYLCAQLVSVPAHRSRIAHPFYTSVGISPRCVVRLFDSYRFGRDSLFVI